ncbi:preprotein translocase subunit SecG [Altererythrobacter atlanticus]|uniref:Protein-export membrane protein SecG n=1 Tax=Croceibacterium atlanticum TaxID=1267766 RepID=A0A0F7KR39_9SPHN|nr:preprotein translocase subunit SecG [Croceibacterium atlanticum]AKH41652.1 Protein-export membrane protein SecG [Croceibacterium atlanticum]MBB5733116.1 preprotein translocase subunit SecG [Croceibacterium atlanticum]
MSLFIFLTVVQAIVAAALVGVVLMQRSEGGGLGMGGGGSPGGLMSARSAGDFLTRTTKWLAILFVGLSILMAAVAVDTTTGRELDDSLQRSVGPAVPDQLIPDEGAAPAAPAGQAAPAENDDPLADVAQ